MSQDQDPSPDESPERPSKHGNKPQRDAQREQRREWADARRKSRREDFHDQRGVQHSRLRQVRKGGTEDWEDYDG